MHIHRSQSLHRSDHAPFGLVRAACVFYLLLSGTIATAQSDANPQPPTFDRIAAALADYFSSLKDYKPNDLLNQSLVSDALAHVTDITGWQVPDQKAIVDRALADKSFVVRQLSTPRGQRFMRSISKYPGGYARLDRLSTISGGQQLIRNLIRMKDGSDMIAYLATTGGGHRLGSMMANVQRGVNLNKPTGRIYTADELLAALQVSYAKATP